MIATYCLLIVLTGWSLAACNSGGQQNNPQAEVLLSNGQNQASVVYLTADEKDDPMVSWAEIDSTGHKFFYFARWDRESGKFSSPVAVPITQNTSIHEEGMPKIIVKGDGTIMAIFEASVPAPGSKWGIGDVQYMTSDDNGKTWSDPASVCVTRTAEESMSFSGVARLSDGEIAVSWLDTSPDGMEGMGRPVMFARTQAGGGFEKPILIEKRACECCRVAVAGGSDGHIEIAYRDLLPGSIRDISITTSFDGGKTFSRPNDFSEDEWEIDGCPHNGPSIVAGNGKAYTAWYSGGRRSGVHYAELDENGSMVSKKDLSRDGRFIQLTLMPDGSRIVAYSESFKSGDSLYSHIVVNKMGKDGFFEKVINSPENHGSYPMVKPVGNDAFLLAWRDGDKVYYKKINTSSISDPGKEIPATPDINPIKNTRAAVNLFKDPVCGMPMDASLVMDSVEYKGKTIRLCSDHCKEMFIKSPEKYLAKVE